MVSWSNKELSKAVRGLFLLILAVSGNFVAETLGCRSQKLLSESILAKHFVLFFILFFSINFVDESGSHPKDSLLVTMCVYLLFVMFTKMNLYFTLLVFSLLMMLYINQTFINYHDSKNNDKRKELHLKFQGKMYVLTVLLIIIGFLLYFKKQYTEHPNTKTWSTYKFIFGTPVCDSLRK
tara:strand:- start:803 stop:1342 length:540 start_codon:yes stop_codon:yes gene_type:complete